MHHWRQLSFPWWCIHAHMANMEPTWVLSAPGGPHVDPMNLAIKVRFTSLHIVSRQRGRLEKRWQVNNLQRIAMPYSEYHRIHSVLEQATGTISRMVSIHSFSDIWESDCIPTIPVNSAHTSPVYQLCMSFLHASILATALLAYYNVYAHPRYKCS